MRQLASGHKSTETVSFWTPWGYQQTGEQVRPRFLGRMERKGNLANLPAFRAGKDEKGDGKKNRR